MNSGREDIPVIFTGGPAYDEIVTKVTISL